MSRNIILPVRPGVWTLVPNDPAPMAEVLVDGFPTADYYERPDVVAWAASLPVRPLEGW